MGTQLPTTTSEINAEWMTDALRGSGTIGPDASVSAVQADEGNAGVGFMGEVAKVTLTYDGDATVPCSRLGSRATTMTPCSRTTASLSSTAGSFR